MKEIGLFQAKTNLSKIAEKVRQTGEPVTLTKHGQPCVDLVPHQPAIIQRRGKSQVISDLARIGKELSKGSFKQIKADIEEGRP